MTNSEIMESFPSICYSCRYARKPAAIENTEKGYVGCCARCYDKDYNIISDGKEVAEGWVDLRLNIFGEKSGIITNYQLLTLMINKCSFYDYNDYNNLK